MGHQTEKDTTSEVKIDLLVHRCLLPKDNPATDATRNQGVRRDLPANRRVQQQLQLPSVLFSCVHCLPTNYTLKDHEDCLVDPHKHE